MPDIVINSLYHLNDCMGIANPLDSVSLYILLHPFQQCCQQYSLDEHQHHPVASSPHRNPYNKAASKCQCPSHSSASKMTVNSQSGPPTSKQSRPPDDLIATAASALRRLHFKTGRGTRSASAAIGKTSQVGALIIY